MLCCFDMFTLSGCYFNSRISVRFQQKCILCKSYRFNFQRCLHRNFTKFDCSGGTVILRKLIFWKIWLFFITIFKKHFFKILLDLFLLYVYIILMKFYGVLLIFVLLFITNFRVFFTRKPRRDPLTVVAPFTFLLSILQIIAWAGYECRFGLVWWL